MKVASGKWKVESGERKVSVSGGGVGTEVDIFNTKVWIPAMNISESAILNF